MKVRKVRESGNHEESKKGLTCDNDRRDEVINSGEMLR